MKVAIVHQENEDVDTIGRYLKSHIEIDSVRGFTDAMTYMSMLLADAIDIAFITSGCRIYKGISLAKETRRLSPETKTVFVTGSYMHAVMAFNEGYSGYMKMPVSEMELDEVISNIKERKAWKGK